MSHDNSHDAQAAKAYARNETRAKPTPKTLDQAWDNWVVEAEQERRLVEAVDRANQALSEAQRALNDFKRSSELWLYYELKQAGYGR